MITEKDFDSIKADGRSLELIKRQYEHLVGGKIKISGISIGGGRALSKFGLDWREV